MTLAVKPRQMKLLVGAAGILGLMLRAVLYTAGVDQKGLLIPGFWADTGLWLLTAVVAAALLIWCRQLTGPEKGGQAFPGSPVSAAGAALAGIALVLSPVAQTTSGPFAVTELVLRIAAGLSLLLIAYFRFRSRTPLFLLHGAVCLYLALRLVCQYRVWSADPQIQNYAFYMGAHVALMITAYQFAALDAGFGSHRNLWTAGLSAIYLSIVSVAGSSDPLFLICCILWIWTNLSHPMLKKHRETPNHNIPQEESK